jgi:hypothetical protein
LGYQYNFQQTIPPNPSTAQKRSFTRESVRSLLFELFPQQDDGVNPLPLLPAIECVSSPKPLSPEHLMGPPVTPFALSQGLAMFPPAPFYQRLPAKIF